MAKAMLIMDMPSSCLHCSCSNIVHGRSRCEETGENLTVDDIYEERPKHCPLREIPQKQNICGRYNAEYFKQGGKPASFKVGYNACIDEILGGGER